MKKLKILEGFQTDMSMYENEDFFFKIKILKYFWNNRDRDIIPSKGNKEIALLKQKYVLFYNLFAMIENKKHTLNSLKAFKDGPVYYDIYSFRKKYPSVNMEELQFKNNYNIELDEDISNAVLLLIHSSNMKQVSNLTHVFEFWRNKYQNESGINDIELSDITENDKQLLFYLIRDYKKFDKNYYYIQAKHNVLLVPKNEYETIEKKGYDKLLDDINEDYNPVIVKLDVDGEGLIID